VADNQDPDARAVPKQVANATPEEMGRVESIDLRCLTLCIGMLERVNGVRVV
jgi:condensin complex subunit 3